MGVLLGCVWLRSSDGGKWGRGEIKKESGKAGGLSVRKRVGGKD